jgi:hypothetical protein
MGTWLQLAPVYKINTAVPGRFSITRSLKIQHVHSMTIFATAECRILWLKLCVTMLKRGFIWLQIKKRANSHNVNFKLMIVKQTEETTALQHKNFTLP